MSRTRKGQMEIMGLAIVIILMLVGIIFVMRFVVSKEAPNIKAEFTKTQMATNFGIALLQTTTEDCKETDITELIIDCAEFESITCSDGRRSCEYANDTIATILTGTMDIWRIPYQLSINVGSENLTGIDVMSGGGCTDNVPGQSEQFFLPSDRGLITVKLFICEVYREP